ncbi:leucine-rich repeat-containing protein 69 isoform X1, partial [Silurus meridionalis]
MDHDLVFQVKKTKPKAFNLNSRNMRELPKGVLALTWLSGISLNNNRLLSLPEGLHCMQQVELNLGNNAFEEMPPVLKHLHSLKKLHLFRNRISTLHPEVLEGLSNLVVLNLNHNKIRIVPTAIKSLSNLERFSIADNQIEEIPAELGLVRKLTEMDFTRNSLSGIPHELYELTRLRKLSLARNALGELPEGILGWKNLRIFDVAGNRLSVFPADFQFLELEEFYFEGNNLIRSELFKSTQDEEVLPLKEHAARFILKERLNKSSLVSNALQFHPDIQAMLSRFGRCAVCFEPFLTTWVECVRFISLRKDMGIKNSGDVPVRVFLCSYSCFNKSSCSYYVVCKV